MLKCYYEGATYTFQFFGWYDNEHGYAHRLIEQAIEVGKSVESSMQ